LRDVRFIEDNLPSNLAVDIQGSTATLEEVNNHVDNAINKNINNNPIFMPKDVDVVQQALIFIIIINDEISISAITTDNADKSTFLILTTRELVKNSSNNNTNNILLARPLK